MKLVPGHVPRQTIDAVRRSLVGRVPAVRREGHGDSEPDLQILGWGADHIQPESAIEVPHYVYSLGVDVAATADDPLAAAKPTMVRFLVSEGTRYKASAEIPVNAMGDANPVPDISSGPSAEEMASVIRLVERANSSDGSFEVRLLRVPALQVAALWLHAIDADGSDWFWLLGETAGDEPDSVRGLDRIAMIEQLRSMSRAWFERYHADVDDDADPSLLGG